MLKSACLMIPNWLGSSFKGKKIEASGENKGNLLKYILL